MSSNPWPSGCRISTSSTIIIAAIVGVLLVVRVETHWNGATPAACFNMTPGHGFKPLDGNTAPYSLTVSKKHVRSGETVHVKLAAISAENLIAGLLIEARLRVDSDRQAFGRFLVAHNDPVVHTINCGADVENAVTHSNASNLQHSVRLTWQAPDGFSGDIVFHATIAKAFSMYWVGKLSPVLRIVDPPLVWCEDDPHKEGEATDKSDFTWYDLIIGRAMSWCQDLYKYCSDKK